jgi:outer membrane immunogenic protein
MKKLVFGALLAIASVGSASAADMAVKARPMPVAEVWNWTGFYIGLNAGGAWSDNSRDYATPFTTPGRIFSNCASPVAVAPLVVAPGPNPFDISSGCSRPSSFIGGAQVGYNWQSAQWVFGLEADGAWQSLIERSFTRFGTNTTANAPFGSVATDTAFFKSEATGLGTFRGRVGYAPGPWMVYATGGLAVGSVKHSATEVLSPGTTCTAPGGNTCRTVADDDTKVGWTIGAGFEWMFARNWSIGAEYLYVDLGRTTLTLSPVAGGVNGATNFFFNTSTARFDDREHVARVKLNYHFNSPVVAQF